MTVIRAENLAKRYYLGDKSKDQYDTFRNMLVRSARSLVRLGQGQAAAPRRNEFWALSDVSFEIKEGERVGIIGRNGAGKSTLLKLLSRITEPTRGRISMRGRVGSLLEVGTGFHPELSGRENIFLNGTVLGMSRAEVRKKFDEIVAFSEVERFLDTPVKRYSSGMYVRLAFAIAAHLEPDVLIVDEVLAVGDADFQKKCLGRMESISESGRTILFVSHSMPAVQQLCNRVLWLEKGALRQDTADIASAAHDYLFGQSDNLAVVDIAEDPKAAQTMLVRRVHVGDADGTPLQTVVPASQDVYVYVDCDIRDPLPNINIGLEVTTEDGAPVFQTFCADEEQEKWPRLEQGRCLLRVKIPAHFLNEGVYQAHPMVTLQFRDWVYPPNVLPPVSFRVMGGLSRSPYWVGKRNGLTAPILRWERLD